MSAVSSIYSMKKTLDLKKFKLEGFSQPEKTFSFFSSKELSVFVFESGLIRVIYHVEPAQSALSELEILTKICKFAKVDVKTVISTKKAADDSFIFSFEDKMIDVSALLSVYSSSIQLNGEFKTQRLLEETGNKIGTELIRLHAPNSPQELMDVLVDYLKKGGFGSIEYTELNNGQYSVSVSELPFAGLPQAKAIIQILQFVLKSAFIHFYEQLNINAKITKNWSEGDPNLMFEVGLINL